MLVSSSSSSPSSFSISPLHFSPNPSSLTPPSSLTTPNTKLHLSCFITYLYSTQTNTFIVFLQRYNPSSQSLLSSHLSSHDLKSPIKPNLHHKAQAHHLR
eukprot:TRINITY_DN38540_c0_g1_i1.p1 TRINITY_DN38540_c0_g1~~TRINITY_DN38540_c0_g1_i1.p1  ORF type:complete len:100 (+),score=13.73 TRINITY_DN38540_c0_g1_i1:568-867(+)